MKARRELLPFVLVLVGLALGELMARALASRLAWRPLPPFGRSEIQEEWVERMDRIVAYQLQRASTSGRRRLAPPQPLRPAVERMLAALTKVYGDKRIATEVAVDAALRFRGDEGDLTELLGNLLDNAFKWGRARIRVSAEAAGASLTLADREGRTPLQLASARGYTAMVEKLKAAGAK